MFYSINLEELITCVPFTLACPDYRVLDTSIQKHVVSRVTAPVGGTGGQCTPSKLKKKTTEFFSETFFEHLNKYIL